MLSPEPSRVVLLFESAIISAHLSLFPEFAAFYNWRQSAALFVNWEKLQSCRNYLAEKLKQQGRDENSLILVFSDNGASSETVVNRGLNNRKIPIGHRGSYIAYGPKGATLSNTPSKGFKNSTYQGGIRSPLIVHWPRKLTGDRTNDLGSLMSAPDLNPSLLTAAGGSANDGKEGIDRLVYSKLLSGGQLAANIVSACCEFRAQS